MPELASTLDAALQRVTASAPGIPGVAAVLTDRSATRYAGAAGVRRLGEAAPMGVDSVCTISSATKALTCTVCLQLAERGALDLDRPAKEYAPEIDSLEVLDGFDPEGTPRLRPPKRDITTRMLLLYTAGLGYDFSNEAYARLVRDGRYPSVVTATRASLRTPLLFDPGERWEYGTGIDWAGQVVEGVTGRRLGEVMRESVLGPLGMTSTGFTLSADMRARLAGVHKRRADGSLRPLDFELPSEPEVDMGGHGLYSTVADYARFLRMWLDDGRGPDGQAVLRPETVRAAARGQLSGSGVGVIRSAIPAQALDVEWFPGIAKSWAMSFLVNDEPAPTGRASGSLAWAGLANVYYWIDRTTGIAGVWMAQVFPFGDPVAMAGYLDFETRAYASL
ncbi:MAG TPA: serine hydrolase domain-containing protein [Jatrophihabitans sp.]|nr:serine hydrolase domain-containing protein [Jatrophihabitans sp.]